MSRGSELGPVVQRLDSSSTRIPHPNVMVEGGIVLLHGVVDNAIEGDDLETAALRMAGVDGVESYLHIGVPPGDTHPSEVLSATLDEDGSDLQRRVAWGRFVFTVSSA